IERDMVLNSRSITAYGTLVLLGMLLALPSAGQLPFSKGVNLTGWFQAPNARQIQFSRFSKNDFENIKSLGGDVVRLPINLHAMTSGQPDYILDTLFLKFLDQVVDWTEALQIHLILDNHTFDVASDTDPAVETPLVKVWTQMAFHFRERSAFLYYEVLNEPHGIDDVVWNNIQQNVIDAIRTQDTTHFIVVGPANWNSYHHLKNLPVYSDDKLIYTFHFYDPFVFTHQGASWVSPSMVPLANVPFPYVAGSMPSTPLSLRGTWIENALQNYPNDGNASKVKQLIDLAAAFKNERGVPVYCGEFGVFIQNSPAKDRISWYALVGNYLKDKGIPWTIWDYTGGFGLFEKDSPEFFEYDLNVPLLEALGFAAPSQKDYIKTSLKTGFTIYEDYFGDGIINHSSSGNGILDFYSSDTPQQGSYCIYWTGVGQYNAINFDFKRDLDLYLLRNNDHALEFYVRGNSPSAKFDVRLIDTNESPQDLPWRMGKTISGIPADNAWHFIRIPLSELEEKGAWEDGTYYIPQGSHFDWRSVDRFEIVPEHQPLDGIEFSFDNIRVVGEEVVVSAWEEDAGVGSGLSVYPNPVAGNSRLEFTTEVTGPVTIGLFNLQGQKLRTLLEEKVSPGKHILTLDRSGTGGALLPAGLYVLNIRAGSFSQSVKVVITRD
ncbi:MAG TPA: cellulase family glycosylhydrolase, partial [Chryseosolibacter sp.]|nr:cellulase family glycosylhydrolase [Chryseosolibacter sp.]